MPKNNEPAAPSIWEACAGARQIRPLRLLAIRAVEAQHLVSTRKLVDSDQEQQVLEDLLEGAKPAMPSDIPPQLHYLLATPFRYPPLPWGSRFGTRQERGIWYGATRKRTALAEAAFYKLLLLEGTTAKLAPLTVNLSLFEVAVATPRGIHLNRSPFNAYSDTLTSKTSYQATQALGQAMRTAGVEGFVYASARQTRGINVGLLSPRAFAKTTLHGPPQTWACTVEPHRVECTCTDLVTRKTYGFERQQFLVEGRLLSL